MQLHRTLGAWGIGNRASRLAPMEEFQSRLQACVPLIAPLETLLIDQPELDLRSTTSQLWTLISELRIVDNDAPLVATTKALHHILPDLVVPMDRMYTQQFFGWHNPQFQYGQAECFRKAFGAFHRIAREANPAQYVGEGWNSSRSKVIDNAIVGVFVEAKSELNRAKLEHADE